MVERETRGVGKRKMGEGGRSERSGNKETTTTTMLREESVARGHDDESKKVNLKQDEEVTLCMVMAVVLSTCQNCAQLIALPVAPSLLS